MLKTKLFDDDDSGNEEIKENSEYAKNYQQWRRKEEEHKCKESRDQFTIL